MTIGSTPNPVGMNTLVEQIMQCVALILSMFFLTPGWAAAPFTVSANGTVLDSSTSLVWDQCSYGRSGSTCAAGTAFYGNWAGALNAAVAANAANYKGFSDWRVPNLKELESLAKLDIYTVGVPEIDTAAFPGTPADWFWSSTSYTPDPGGAWSVYFGGGNTSGNYNASTSFVRLVRSGQSFASFDSLNPNAPCAVGGTVTGQVRDASTGQGLSNITVNLGASATTSAANGSFSFSAVAAGRQTLSVTVPGFAGGGTPVNVCGDTPANVLLTKNQSTYGASAPSGYAADPVNTATGNYTFNRTDLKLPGKGLGFAFERGYNAMDPLNGPLGFGWTHSYHTSLAVDGTSNVTVRHGDGHTVTFAPDGSGGYTAQYGVFDTLVKAPDASYTLTQKDQRVYRFGADLRLQSIADRNGNTIALSYTGALLTRITDTAGRPIDLSYDASGRITQLTDPLGRTVRFSYNPAGDLITSTDPAGQITNYSYDANHQMLTATDPRGNVFVSNTYDAALRVVTSQRDAKLGQTSYVYNPLTRQTTITNPLGQVSTHTHDSLLRLIQEDDPLGHSQRYTYDTAGNRSSVTDRNGNRTTYDYDVRGNVTVKTDALGNTTRISYDSANNPLTRTDALGKVASFAYDAKGNLTSTTDALGNVTSTTYDSAGLPTGLTDARGNVTSYLYDAAGNLSQIRDALTNSTLFTYDAAGRRLTRSDALSHTTAYAYDANDNLLTSTDPAGGIVSYSYDGNNNRISSTDKLGRTTTTVYDAKDLPTTVTNALGGISSASYDALDRKLTSTDPRGKVTLYAYDAAGRLTSSTNALGQITQYAYDAQGNRTSVTDALGHSSSVSYDALNRAVQSTDALGQNSSSTLDALGRVLTSTNAKGQITSFSYDDAGRLTQVTDALGGILSHAYDAAGNRISTTDPKGNVTSYAYDALNRITTQTEPGGFVTRIGYDAVGNRSQLTKPDGSVISYSYDALDRLTQITNPNASTVSFAYDANGKRTAMTDSLGSSSYSYDALERLTSTTSPHGKTVGYAYDATGNLVSLTYPDGKQVSYTYDGLNRLTSLTDWASRSTSYNYDAAGRLGSTGQPNGTLTGLGYDNANRLTALIHMNGLPASPQAVASYAYTLDALGNQTQVTGSAPIAPVIPSSSTNYSYSSDNRLTQVNATTQSFDANGNQTTKGTDSYTWDAQDRLLQNTVAGSGTTSYQYDGSGNRLARTTAAGTTRFVLDVNAALPRVLAETNSAGNITAWYVYGLGLVARVDASNNVRYYHHDSRGSTVALTDNTGAVTDRYAYDPFGTLVNSSGSSINPYKYVGRYGLFDEGNGLVYIRARYYNPAQGRFISKDPKPGSDTDAQSLNRYVYAMNNPVRFVDVSGLTAKEVAGGQVTYNRSSDSDRRHQLLMEVALREKERYEIEAKNIRLDSAIEITEAFKGAISSIGACINPIGIVGFGCVKAVSDQGLHAVSVISGDEQMSTKTFEFYGSKFGETGQSIGSLAEDLYAAGNATKHWYQLNKAVGKMDGMLSSSEKTFKLFTEQTGPIKFVADIADVVLFYK
ncbi:MAG: DUF1566 domain-containing protein [Comamonadaceae bacterium]|nr:DUF1566 domain-containing protein [Comamonadaceae bacterium]